MAYSIRNILNLDGSSSHDSSSPSPSGSVPSSLQSSSEEDSYVTGVQEEMVMVGEQGDSLVREADSEQQSKSAQLALAR